MEKYYYLIHIQFLGFRYHGWQKQPGVKTVESMIEKTIGYVLGHSRFKILGASRTDAMVSASHSVFEVFLDEFLDQEMFKTEFNRNLPGDIRAIKIEETHKEFNIIQAPGVKEYHYLFCINEKAHPFCAPLIASFQENLDIYLMKKGARLFEGEHDFAQYCTKPSPDAILRRTVLQSEIMENKILKANFFPEKTYVFCIQSKGFMRNQVRLIMGQLVCLGKGEITLQDIEASLKGKGKFPLRYIAPASGLMLHKIEFSRPNPDKDPNQDIKLQGGESWPNS